MQFRKDQLRFVGPKLDQIGLSSVQDYVFPEDQLLLARSQQNFPTSVDAEESHSLSTKRAAGDILAAHDIARTKLADRKLLIGIQRGAYTEKIILPGWISSHGIHDWIPVLEVPSMNSFILILIALMTSPIYFGWLLPIVIIGVFEIIWAFFTIMIPLLLLFKLGTWSTAKTAGAVDAAKIKFRSLELESLAAELMRNLAMESDATACACIGGSGPRKHVVIHVRSGSRNWSYAQAGKSELAALNRVYERRGYLTGKRTAMRCLSDCPIASRCPNRTQSIEFREILRCHQQAGSTYAA